MTNCCSARACAVKPLRLVAQPLRALGLDRSARPSKEGCRDMNAGNLLEGTATAFGKKESKEEALLATAKALDKRDLIYGFRTPAHHGPCHALGAGVRKPPKNETAGEGTKGRAVFGVSARAGGPLFVQPERYGTKIARWGKVTSSVL